MSQTLLNIEGKQLPQAFSFDLSSKEKGNSEKKVMQMATVEEGERGRE
jgi:hypothetical protein